MENWKKLDFEVGYDNYSVSDLGRIRNDRTGTILKEDISNMGYARVNLYNTKTKKQKKFAIHRLVALYFVSGDTSLVVNHMDGNKTNNKFTNLEWVTTGENNSHAYKTNLKNQDGVKNPSNVYTEDQIRNICELIEQGLDTKTISNKIFNEYNNTYKNLINHIKGKRRWTSISKDYNF